MRTLLSFLALIVSPGLWYPRASGRASYYSEEYRGKTMANGQPFNPDALTCATWKYPLGSVLMVRHYTPRGNWRSVVVTVTDRGPDKRLGRLIDLSRAAFKHLTNLRAGLIDVDVELLGSTKGGEP